jgi:prepilin-type N-terminal cleavage/methylation domain-containing protein
MKNFGKVNSPPRVAGFTLIELLVVIAIIAILAAMLLPVLTAAKVRAQCIVCTGHFSQLQKACVMYNGDSRDLFPPNPDSVSTVKGYNWVGGSESGCPPPTTGNNAEAGDSTYLTDPTWDLLAPYIGWKTGTIVIGLNSVFKCPADPRTTIPPAGAPAGTPASVPVVRSISCNQGVGTIVSGWTSGDPSNGGGIPSVAVYGPWLTGSHSESYSQYATFGKTSDFKVASPSEIWVYVDEDPYSINDAAMAVSAEESFIDWPSQMHKCACGFSFADGHAEMHKWLTTGYPMVHNSDPGDQAANSGTLYRDWWWWAYHATRNKNTGVVP